MTTGPGRLIAVTLTLAAAAAGCGSSSTASSSAGAIVPWANRPIPLYVAPAPKPLLYPTSAPACRADQLEVSQGRGGVGLGNRLEKLVFTNTGRPACLLRGYPRISGITRDELRRTLPARHGGTYFGQLVAADLPPGGHVFLEFGTSNNRCGNNPNPPATTFRRLLFRLPDGGIVRAGRHVWITEVCSIDMTRFGLPEEFAPASGPLAALRIHARLPKQTHSGTVLHFTVTIVDPAATDIELHPCPGFTEAFYGQGATLKRSFRLNCDTAHAIPADGRVRYAMELPIPARARSGLAKIGWALDTPYGPYTGGAVEVTG